VWGTGTSLTAGATALPTAILKSEGDGRSIYAWSTEDPPLHARFRMEWSFRSRSDEESSVDEPPAPSQVMSQLGIVQESDPRLRQISQRFDLPAEASEANEVLGKMRAAMQRIGQVQPFSKGMGLAAPQIGIDRAAAIVLTPEGDEIILLNPRVIDESAQTDEQYEGCMSYFDVRGEVPRPLMIEVEHREVDGSRRITVFERGHARLVMHEIDHLNGVIYRDRMRPGVEPIPVSEYKGTGRAWRY
jgi:peptide deformylase